MWGLAEEMIGEDGVNTLAGPMFLICHLVQNVYLSLRNSSVYVRIKNNGEQSPFVGLVR